MGMMSLGTIVTAGGQLYSGLAGKSEADSAANMEKYNAQVELRRKHMIEQRGKSASILQAKAASRGQSSLVARMAASGGVIQTGSYLEVLGAQAIESERENLMIGYDTQVAASQAQSAADLHKMQASIYKQKGKNLMTAAFITAGTSLLQGFGGKGGGGNTVGGKPRSQDLWEHQRSSPAGTGGSMTAGGRVGG